MRSDLLFGSLATASRDVSLPLIAAQLNLHRLQPCAHLTYSTLATAPRRPPALHVSAPLSPYRLSRVLILLTRLARDRTAARQPSVLPRSSALEGWSPRAYLATWHACDRIAASRQPVPLIAAQPSPRGLDCALILQCGRLVRPPRGVNLPFIVAQLSPRELGRALILQCGRLVRPPRGVNLPPILSQLSPRRLSGARADYSSARLRPHRGVSLPFIAAQLSPYAGSAVCAHTNHVARLRSHRGASLRPHCRAAQPSRTAALRAVLARLRPHHGLSLLFMPHNSVLTGVVVRPSC